MEYVSERIVNIADMERLVRSAYNDIASLRREMEKENPSMLTIDELSKQIHLELLKAKDFDFQIEKRKVSIPVNFSEHQFRA